MENLKKLLDEYKQNMSHQQELDEALHIVQTKDEWVASLKNRANQMHLMYKENNEILNRLDTILSVDLSPADADTLYQEADEMYWGDYDDCQILLPILYKLIDYYEKNVNDDRLIFLYNAAFYEESEILNRRIGTKGTSVDYNLKILAYCNRYCQFEDLQTRNRIWSAYYNYIVVGLGNKVIDLETSYHALLEARKLWESPDVQALDGSNETINRIFNRIRHEWLASEEFIKDAPLELQQYFCQEADTIFSEKEQNATGILDIDSEIYAAYLHSQVLQGKMSYDDIAKLYLDYCDKKMDICMKSDEISDEDSYFLINAPSALIRWLEYGVSEERAAIILDVVKDMTHDKWHEKLSKYSTPFVNEILADWCFKFLKHLEHPEEKEEWLFRLLIHRQLPTYLHSVMVSRLAEEFYKHAVMTRPELFASLPKDVSKNVLKYVRQCSLLHDIGKTKITDIVNTQIRCLCDKEFTGIRQHPEYGAAMISSDSDLSKYHDVLIGHHKFYDGTGGYPKHFDNTASPYRIVIDLITLCDCIDAASDHYGRNYKASKSLEELLCEFESEKGTRYNPDLVDILSSSIELQDCIRHIITDGRIDIMYEAYKDSFF